MKKIGKFLGVIFGCFMAVLCCVHPVYAAEDNIAEGVIGSVVWEIDAQGHLTVSGTGDFVRSDSYDSAPWYNYREEILSASINVKGATNASFMFYECTALQSVDLSEFDMSTLENMMGMFSHCQSLESLDLSSVDTGRVTNMKRVFEYCFNLQELDLSGLDTGAVTSMYAMFECCNNISELDLSTFDTSKVVDLSCLFNSCYELEKVDVSSFDTSKAKNMHAMFQGCKSLKTVDLSSFDTSNVNNMVNMFQRCENMEFLDLSHFDTKNVTKTAFMFNSCYKLKKLDLSSFDAENMVDMSLMFQACHSLIEIKTPVNCKEKVQLPFTKEIKWKTPDGEIIEYLPMEQKESIVIRKGEVDITELYVDVHNDWYTEYVRYVYLNDLMTGIGGTLEFRPNANITKAQVAQVLYNMLPEKPMVGDLIFEFKILVDVYQNEWYATAVSWAYDKNIITGDLNTKCFYPNADVTREELALMLYRFAVSQGYDVSECADLTGAKGAEQVSDWAKTAVEWAVGSSMIKGIEKDGEADIAPQETATRAQVAAILQRFETKYNPQ